MERSGARRCYERKTQHGKTPTLYSRVGRGIALLAICKAIGDAIQTQAPILLAAASRALEQATAMVTPDRTPIMAIQRSVDRITTAIQYLLRNPGDTEVDRAESEQELKQLRTARAQAAAELAAAEKAAVEPQAPPTAEQIDGKVADITAVLVHAADPLTTETSLALRTLLQHIIDGPVMVSQATVGPWQPLVAHFTVRLDKLIPGMPTACVEPVKLDVDLVKEDEVLAAAEEIMAAYDTGLTMKQVAKQCGFPKDRVMALIRQQLTARGFTEQDAARTRLPRTITNGHSKHLLRMQRIMVAYDRGDPLGKIAKDLKIDIHRVTDVVKAWFKEQGKEAPDGRNRRKDLGNR